MPQGNGTGPAGLGPMTGRAAGYCAGYPLPGYMNAIPGRGLKSYNRSFFNRRRGFSGRGRGRSRGPGFQTIGRIPYPGYR
jgi:hypothetical protein